MAVLPSSGEAVFFCDHGKYRSILIYRNEEHQRSIKPPCDHIKGVNILGLEIEEEEFIAVSCAACGTIKLMDFENNPRWVTVFSAPGEQPRKMFQGEDFSMMVFMCEKTWSGGREHLDGTLWELRISDDDEFTLIKKTPLPGVWNEDAPMCYVPIPRLACVYKTDIPGTIRAVSVYTDEVMWESCWRSPTVSYIVESISYSRVDQKILVSDGERRQGRVFILDPRDGSLLQTITLEGIEHTKELQISGNYLVVWHHDTMATNYQVSYLSVKSTKSEAAAATAAEPQNDMETYLLPVTVMAPTAPPQPSAPSSSSSSWSLSSVSSHQPPAYHPGLVPQLTPSAPSASSASAPGLPPSYSMLSLFSAPAPASVSSLPRMTSSPSAPSLGSEAATAQQTRVRTYKL